MSFDWDRLLQYKDKCVAGKEHVQNEALIDLHERMSELEDAHKMAVCTCDTVINGHDAECQMAKAAIPHALYHTIGGSDLQARVDEFVKWVQKAWICDGEGGRNYKQVSLTKNSILAKLRELGFVEKED